MSKILPKDIIFGKHQLEIELSVIDERKISAISN